nr:cytochrome P450 708A13 [Iberis amara]
MSFIWSAALWVIAIVVVVISKWWYRWSNPKCNGKLPPGSMGYPIVGETFEYFKPHGFYEISPFVKKRILQYGPLFRTNIFGSKTVVLTEPDVVYEVFRQENKSFVFNYPDALVKPFGVDKLLHKHGNFHKHIKHIILQLLGSETLKQKLIVDMNRVTCESLRSKATQGTFDVKDAVESLITAHLTPKIISDLKAETRETLLENINAFKIDWFRSFLTISTWRSIHEALKVRRYVVDVVKKALSIRNASKEKHGDFLDTLVEELEDKDTFFNLDSASNLVFSLMVVSKDSISVVICLVVKFISENRKALEELKSEHEEILRNREDKEAGVSWDEYRHKMTFTNMVINETLRMTNVAPIMFRKAVNDVEIKGYTIPAGWIAAVVPSAVHYDKTIFENPLEFNPWRWEGKDLRSASKTFMVFGAGVRQCAGAEFSRLQISIFIHHLVTKYDFSLAEEFEFMRTPITHLPKGLPINISQSSK